MNYVNFHGTITAKIGLVTFGWPLPGFKSPSNMTHMEAEVVLRAFESGAAGFRSLSDEEWRSWLATHYAPQAIAAPDTTPVPEGEQPTSDPFTEPDASPVPDSVVAGEKRPLDTTEDPGQRKRACLGPTPVSLNFVNSGTPLHGGNFEVPKATRKPRKDKGEKRGPYKKRAVVNSENEHVIASAPPPKKQPRPRKAQKIADPITPTPVIVVPTPVIVAPAPAPVPVIVAPAPAPVPVIVAPAPAPTPHVSIL